MFTAILYRASTGTEQGFPCEVFHTWKKLFSLQGTPVLIAGTPVFITGISLWENFTGNTLFSLQGMGLQCSIFLRRSYFPYHLRAFHTTVYDGAHMIAILPFGLKHTSVWFTYSNFEPKYRKAGDQCHGWNCQYWWNWSLLVCSQIGEVA